MFNHQFLLYEHDYKSRHNELLREAEIRRLLKPAKKLDAPQSHLYQKVLSSVGHQLVSLGQRLERLEDNPSSHFVFEKSDGSD